MEKDIRFAHKLYDIDSCFILYYGENKDKVLYPCEQITDPEMCLGVVGNSKLNPRAFKFSGRDRNPIKVSGPTGDVLCTLELPGKSAMMILNPEDCSKAMLQDFVTNDLNGNYDRHDNLYTATVAQINEAGWQAVWAPLQLERKIKHARLVPQTTMIPVVSPLKQI